MKNYMLFSVVLFVCTLSGCMRTCLPENTTEVSVELTVRPECMTAVTRSTDETTIRDLNFYLYDSMGVLMLHRFQNSVTLRFECPPGRYRVRIAANIGRNIGRDTDLERFMLTHSQKYDVLPMTYEGDITVSSCGQSSVVLPPLEVRRLVAKVSYNITVVPADIELHSIRVCSVPESSALFAGTDMPSQAAAGYTDTAERMLMGCKAAGMYYLLPNPQGSNPAITDQRQKNRDHAPRSASYLLIRATRAEKVLAYRIYLGENNTSDFNVLGNTLYSLDITIRGESEVDTRVSGYTVSVWDDFEQEGSGGYCVVGQQKHLFIAVESNGDYPALTYTVEVSAGDSGALSIDATSCVNRTYVIGNGNGMNTYLLDYAPPLFGSTNSTLRYTVQVRDEYGFCREFTFIRRFANILHLHILGRGSVSVSSAFHTTDTADGKMILGSSCTLTAAAEAGFRFVGWYADAAGSSAVSTSALYRYTAQSHAQTLYARFAVADHTPLDTQGTANCYIAPRTLTRYSFDATVVGKGDWSTNIQPKKLSGTTAKVIWETGAHDASESVVRDALYDDGRIYFSTGSKRGNALIGLFDASGTCIWSWHIWAVDYDPAAAAVTYGSGARFMDRNLGVQSKSLTEHGLYYQWGRKDPFIFSEGPNAPKTPAATYTLPGYEFGVHGNTGNTYCPASNYTVEWATAHPTTLLTRPFKSTLYLDSWLYTTNPNLWGNATSGSIASAKSKKSIYDPCPPGWKVPDRTAWVAATFRKRDIDVIYGADMFYDNARTAWTYYPYNGYISGESGIWRYTSLNAGAYVWTNEPYLTPANDMGYCIRIDDGSTDISKPLGQQYGCAVRCVRE